MNFPPSFFPSGQVSLACIAMLLVTVAVVSCQKHQGEAGPERTEEERHLPEHALAGVEVREGLEATLFASEDRVRNPTNMDVDDKGRVWITEGVNYRPSLNPEMLTKEEGDRIVILEDTDGDGEADTEKVFYQGQDINSALGIMVLDNMVYVSRSPDVLVLTDTTGNDQADTKEVLFTGIGGEDHDHGIHAFVFGPDGKLYFNAGDAGRQVRGPGGEIIVDMAGNRVTQEDGIYRKGMVFRSSRDGSDFEVLGHNFRNSYEVAVDSYGTLWQSDNDDDGNRSARVNFVMEYGNFGYTDEMTGSGWRSRRVNAGETVHDRHWHQNDPGVVPNLLNTGSGSPAGIILYEGTLLPERFHNQMIHAEPGHNVVRAYPVEKDGAGYRAVTEDIMKARDNQWIRPIDVTVAPDGSIFVADWYDPGVGGHQYRAPEKGRVYRIAPEHTPYRVPAVDYSTHEGAAEALKSPNHAIRSKAWLRLHAWGKDAEPTLTELWNAGETRFRARALWLLTKIEGRGKYFVDQALEDADPDIRITGLRAARQLDLDLIALVERLIDDPSPQVRREAVIALRHHESPEAPRLWAQLALQHDGHDRWYLEALGIGADGQWDSYLDAWIEAGGDERGGKASRDIIWRARTNKALPMLSGIIRDDSLALNGNLRYFRAFNFHSGPEKTEVLISLLNTSHKDHSAIASHALQQLDPAAPERYPAVREALERALVRSAGTYEFLDLTERFRLENQNRELIKLVLAYPDSSLGSNAARHMLSHGGSGELSGLLNSEDHSIIQKALQALSSIGNDQALDFLRTVVLDEGRAMEIRQLAVDAFGSGSWSAEDRLLDMAREGLIPPSLRAAAANVLMGAYRGSIRDGAVEYLQADLPGVETGYRPVAELLQLSGDIDRGRAVFRRSCQLCHQADGQGTHFGPELSVIGDKLPREALYNAILEPDAGIVIGYEGNIITLTDESRVSGIIDSETDGEIVLRFPGGITNRYETTRIASRERMTQSLMPALQAGLQEQELVDLVEYLTTLKNYDT
ncbi:MAG: PVC-type heme-binding CxxCH protein [Balneolales bacterium]